ncbi:MAG TPA: methyltransferase domain-containing protein, partial [Rudaea sp.]
RFHLAAARGETPPTQPREMVAALFDTYANRFDRHLVGQLQYRVPRRVAEILLARRPDRRMDVLDLGSGTGLLGVYLGRVDGALVGVDLSPRMLQEAARHGVYSELRENELLAELRARPQASFDFVVANDVFIYVGDLSEVIPACARVLRPGGALVFSCESAAETEGALVLRASRRYAHSQASIQALCAGSGFARTQIEPVTIRLDGTVPVHGFIAIAELA